MRWFKTKDYGWGWYPASWQGWLVMLVWLAVVVKIFLGIDADSHSVSDTLIGFIVPLAVSVALLFVVCWVTGEHPEWRWHGRPASFPKLLVWALAMGLLAVIAGVAVVLVQK